MNVSGTIRQLNPVLDRELRQRSRNGRSVVVLVVFLLLALGVASLSYLGETVDDFDDPFAQLSSGVGRTMFEWVLILELVLLLFVVPGLSASAITGERDRQTLIPLQVTMMSPSGIFFGKVLSSSSFVLLLIVASTPILAVAYLLGGITIMQAIQGVVALVFIGVVLAVIGVACSALMRGSAAATLFAYGMSLLLMMGTGFAVLALVIVYVALGNDNFDMPPRLVSLPLLLNPFVSLSYAAGDINDNINSPWPLSGIKQGMAGWEDTAWLSGTHFGNGFDEPGALAAERSGWIGLELWMRAAVAQAAMASLLAWRGIKRLTTPSEVVRQ